MKVIISYTREDKNISISGFVQNNEKFYNLYYY